MAEFLPKNELALIKAQAPKIKSWYELGPGVSILWMMANSKVGVVNYLDENIVRLKDAANKKEKPTIPPGPWSKQEKDQKTRVTLPEAVYLSGQYRMACALLAAIETPNTKIFFQDFLNNEYQKPMLQYLDIEARSGNLVVLKPKKDFNIAAAKKAMDDFSKDSR